MTEDHITVGLLYADNEGIVTCFISDERLKIIKKLVSPNLYNHFNRYVKALQNNKITYSDLDYQSRYQNGYIKITKPSPAACNHEAAKMIFELKIDTNYNRDED